MSAADPGQKVKSGRPARPSDQDKSRAQPLLFAREDWSLYCSLATLPQRAGVSVANLPRLVVKEITDNALDSADAAGNPGAVEIEVDENDNLIVADQGTGIPNATPEDIAHLFCVARPMVSSKLLRRPTRGAVGNGLRVAMGYLVATRGGLIVETDTIHVTMTPEIDGTSQIVASATIPARQGLRLVALAGDMPFTEAALTGREMRSNSRSNRSKPHFPANRRRTGSTSITSASC